MIPYPTKFTLNLAAEGMPDRGNRNHQIVSPLGICAKSLVHPGGSNDDGRGIILGMCWTLKSSRHQEGPDDQLWAKFLHIAETYVSLK
jgi:hypothetical protein